MLNITFLEMLITLKIFYMLVLIRFLQYGRAVRYCITVETFYIE